MGLPGWTGQREQRPGRRADRRGPSRQSAGHRCTPRYAAFDVGPRTYNTNEFRRFLVGAKGTLGEWDIDTAYLHSSTNLVNERTGYLRYSAVRTALADPDSPVGYWRIGDDAGLNSQALYDFISPTIHANASSSLNMVDFKASRSLRISAAVPWAALGADGAGDGQALADYTEVATHRPGVFGVQRRAGSPVLMPRLPAGPSRWNFRASLDK